MDTNYINNEELTIYMEDRVLEAINKIPLEEQYFLIIVLFLKFVFCYGVELTCSFIFLILAVLSKTPSKMSKYLIDAIMKIKNDRLIIVITHSDRLMLACDFVIELSQGTVINQYEIKK